MFEWTLGPAESKKTISKAKALEYFIKAAMAGCTWNYCEHLF